MINYLSALPELLVLFAAVLLGVVQGGQMLRWTPILSRLLILIALVVELGPASTPATYWGFQQDRFSLLGKAILLLILLVILTLSKAHRSFELRRLGWATLLTGAGMLTLSASWIWLTWIGFAVVVLLGAYQVGRERRLWLIGGTALTLFTVGLLGLAAGAHTLSWVTLHDHTLYPAGWMTVAGAILALSGALIPLAWI
ncbi:MAG: hypothetical protein ACREN8_08215, partial [Candidatus Dormibacteraceae bacterium]